jgi:hypothetical protein
VPFRKTKLSGLLWFIGVVVVLILCSVLIHPSGLVKRENSAEAGEYFNRSPDAKHQDSHNFVQIINRFCDALTQAASRAVNPSVTHCRPSINARRPAGRQITGDRRDPKYYTGRRSMNRQSERDVALGEVGTHCSGGFSPAAVPSAGVDFR